MNYIVATFTSRNETLAFVRVLRNAGLVSEVINTPAGIVGHSCSISVKIPANSLAMAQRLLSGSRFMTFQGFFYLTLQNGRMIAEKI